MRSSGTRERGVHLRVNLHRSWRSYDGDHVPTGKDSLRTSSLREWMIAFTERVTEAMLVNHCHFRVFSLPSPVKH